MNSIFAAIAMTDQLLRDKADGEIAGHAATARALRREERETGRRSATRPDPWLGFLPRVTSYPYGR